MTKIVQVLVIVMLALPVSARFAADVNADGEVNIADDTVLRRSLAGLAPGVSRFPDLSGTYSGEGFGICDDNIVQNLIVSFTVTQNHDLVDAIGIVENLTFGFSSDLQVFLVVTPDGTVHGTTISSTPVIAAPGFSLVIGNFIEVDGEAFLIVETINKEACVSSIAVLRLVPGHTGPQPPP